jgi:hypothetical protein
MLIVADKFTPGPEEVPLIGSVEDFANFVKADCRRLIPARVNNALYVHEDGYSARVVIDHGNHKVQIDGEYFAEE